MRILGISCFYHDAAACVYGDEGVVAAAEEERFSRRKHDSGFPAHALAWVMRYAGVRAADLDGVVYYEKPLRKFERILAMTVDGYPTAIAHFVPAMRSWLGEKLWVSSRIRDLGYRAEILYGEHHLSHAASAYYASPFPEAAILTLDGVGERATTTIGRGDGLDLELLEEIHFPHSLGLLYSVLTAFLGFEVNEGEYKLMGLAAFGRPRYADRMRLLIEFADDRSYRLDQRFFAYARRPAAWTRHLEELLGPPFSPGALEGEIDERAADIAASIQLVTEEAILTLAERARTLTGSRRLCFAGGVAQNVLANGRLLRDRVFDDVFVPSSPGDSGGAVGAAAYVAHAILRRPRPPQHSAYLGPSYDEAQVRTAVERSGLPHRELGPDETVRETARLIAEGQIVGWFQGRMEFGPRALGARSILADARDPEMKAKVNARIKFREAFRPFAPAVVADEAHRYFEDRFASPYMSFAAVVRPDALATIPAVTHVDGTSRIQTVRPNDNPLFYALLREFGRITGHPILMNTSFNIRGEPIVATPEDAIDCFIRTSLDALLLERYLVLPGTPAAVGVRSARHDERMAGIAIG
jgi:carbamoyltransferase